MSGFDDRGDAFEKKFAHDEQIRFKVQARRNKLLGLWAAELMGKADAQAYALEVIKSDFEEAGDEDVIRKLSTDLGDLADRAMICAQIDAFLVQAKDEIANES